MENMQDKEFDKLFQQKFEGFEVEPSSKTWKNVIQKLDNKVEDKKSFQSYWAVAATIAIITIAGLWFSKPGEKIRLHGKAKVIEPFEEPKAVIPQVESMTKFGSAEKVVLKNEGEIAVKPFFKPEWETKPEIFIEKAEEEIAYEETAPEEIKISSKEKKSETKVEEKALATVQDTSEALWAMADNGMEQDEALKAVDKNRNSVGNLVNFVISKVDKRENKIIEFTDTDEGSMVSGINLGLVRFKSRK